MRQTVPDTFSFKNILDAYRQCRRRKRKTINAAKFELNFESGLLKLEKELKDKIYFPGRAICFVITNPKPREVFAADFRDRIIHHLLVGYLEPFWEKKFIHHSYACRRGKGAHLAIKDLKRFIRQASQNLSRPAHYLQADISSFFMSLKKNILLKIIARHLKNPDMLWLTEQIINYDPTKNFYYKGDPKLHLLVPPGKSLFSVPAGQGLPIGNLTSQFFANVYLNELDQFAKHHLKIKYYLRYVDDLILIHKNPQQLKLWQEQINQFLNDRLELKLQPQKTVLQSVYKGVNFVGFIVNPRHTLMRRRIVGNLKNKLWQFNHSPIPETVPPPQGAKDEAIEASEIFSERLQKILAVVNSYYGQFKHAQTFNLRRAIYRRHFGVLKTYLEPANQNFNYFKIKKHCPPLKES